MRILMLAAENGALPGGKAGGLGDVLRDVPLELAALGHCVDVLTPGYQHFSRLPGAQCVAQVDGSLRGRHVRAGLYRLPDPVQADVRYWALEHSGFAPEGAGRIYCADPPQRPFATDANKFALFSMLAAQCILNGSLGRFDVIHLHDWHAALVAVLAHFHPDYVGLRGQHLVYSIHNLSLQGIRPLDHDDSSLRQWFPELQPDLGQIGDPRYPDCFNPMRAAINLCQRVHAVSPTYAREILRPSDPQHGFVGGEGLELDLQRAAAEGRLVGILNGCEYPDPPAAPLAFAALLQDARSTVLDWLGEHPSAADSNRQALNWLERRLAAGAQRPKWLLTSVGRCTEQKLRVLLQPLGDGRACLQHLLDLLGEQGALLLIGSGDSHYESQLAEIARQRENLLFLRGYSESLASDLYASGDLFLMPSSYEPCGISQMLAMRGGQPCLVHAVGGLLDTVEDDENGFLFHGDSPQGQAEALLARLQEVMQLRSRRPARWRKICANAAAARFSWPASAQRYLEQLYTGD
jgi:starch synthase